MPLWRLAGTLRLRDPGILLDAGRPHRRGETTPSGLPDTRPTGALLLLYGEGTARRIAARRSHTARGVIDPRFSTGMPRASAMWMAMPVPPSARPRPTSTRTHRPADPASRPTTPPRSSHAACGRPANTAPTPDAGARRSPCRPTAQPRTAPGSPARHARCSPATVAGSSAGPPALPRQTRCRLRPPRRSRDASRSGPAILPSRSYPPTRPSVSPAPRSPHIAMSPCPDLTDVEYPRSLSISGLAPRTLFSTSPAQADRPA